MMKSMISLALLLLVINASEVDVNTFSNYLEVKNEHLRLEWLLDITKATIQGIAEYNFRAISSIKIIQLDIYSLDIEKVYLSSGTQLKYAIDSPDPESDQGERLTIDLDRTYVAGELIKLRINYKVDDRSRAISFMTKEQTQTATHPFLFSQCEDANCRSLAPLQDTPAIKQTYDAVVLWENIWSKDINVFMSAELIDNSRPLMGNYGSKVLSRRSFELKIKIPSYLIAIVGGNIAKKPTSSGGRTFVISEDNSKLNEYVFELQDMEAMLQNIEAYVGPYAWGTYSIVILPPSFPMGGMENPLLTFASPTIMVGDGSGLSTAIHEMAHSWFGNTVTCVNWANMWINEGLCVFLERKAALSYYSQLYTPEQSDTMYRIAASNGNSSLYEDIVKFGFDNSFSSLHPDTKGVNPDISFSQLPYQKGFQLLTYLDQVIGQDAFKQLLREYLAFYEWQSIDENDFYNFVCAFVTKQPDSINKLNKITAVYKKWVYEPGLSPIKLDFYTPAISDAQNLARAFIDAKGAPVSGAAAKFNSFLPTQKPVFLQYLVENYKEVLPATLNQLDNTLLLSKSKDFKIQYRWFRTCLLTKDETRLDIILPWMKSIGGSTTLQNLYKALKEIDLELARKTFQEGYSFYHPTVRSAVTAILYPKTVIQ